MRRSGLNVYCTSLCRTVATIGNANPKFVNTALSGKGNFERDFQKSHIETNFFQKFVLALGSGVISITNPFRGDMVAVMGEVTGLQAWEYIYSKMMKSSEGKQILEEKPRISSEAVDLEKLKGYPEGTLGKAYSNFLEKYKYTPDTRNAVQFVDDVELAYVAQRYREGHDLFHTLLGMPTNMLGEVTVKWVEAIQFKLPMCAAGALFGAVRLAPKFNRSYSTKPYEIEVDPLLEEDINKKKILAKNHPGVMKLRSSELPKKIVRNINLVLENHNLGELYKAAEVFERKIHRRDLPVESSDYELKKEEFRTLYLKKHPNALEDSKSEEKMNENIKRKLKSVLYNWTPTKFDKSTCLKYLVSRSRAEYAAVTQVLWEIRKRDKDFLPKTLFDFGSGVGTVVWGANELWGESLTEYYCIDASGDMNDLASMILRGNDLNNPPIIKEVYYRGFLPVTPKSCNIIVSAFSFFELPNFEVRLKTLVTLWNHTSDYLVLIENGTNAGFKIINEARDFILNISKQQQVECYVFAPCPHDKKCPRLFEPGKRVPCNFRRVYEESKNNFTEFLFSYVIFKKGEKPDLKDRQCRIVRDVLQRHKHVVCHLCTNKGKLNQVVFSKTKHGKAFYKCMKLSNWGDLVPGVLTEVQKNKIEELCSDSSDDDSDSEMPGSYENSNEDAKK